MFTVGDVRDLSLLKENGTDHVLAESLSASALLVYHSTTSSSAHRLLCAQRAAYLRGWHCDQRTALVLHTTAAHGYPRAAAVACVTQRGRAPAQGILAGLR